MLDLGHKVLGDGDDFVAALSRQHQLGAPVRWVGHARHVSVRLEVPDELGHRLLGDLGAFGEHGSHAPGAPMEHFMRAVVAEAAHGAPSMDAVLAIAARNGIELLGPVPAQVQQAG